MKDTPINLFRRSSLVFKNYLREAIQISKRAMLRVGFVPPPFRIQIDITDRCNFRCPTCTKWKVPPSNRELRTDEWETVFEKIRNVPLLREVSIGGGEPFTRKDIFDILGFAKRQNLYTVLISNGWLVDGDVLKQLARIGVDRLMVSLNSLRETVHDQSREARGSYKRIIRLIESWEEQGRRLDLCLATVIMEQNCGELSLLAEFAHENGLNGIIFQVLAHEEAHYPFSSTAQMPQSAHSWYNDDPLWVRSTHLLRREIQELLRLKKEAFPIINPFSQLRTFPTYYEDPDEIRKLPCLSPLTTLYIDPLGDIRLCYGFPPIGNILRDNPRQVWRSDRARRIRLEAKKCTRLCRLLNNNQ